MTIYPVAKASEVREGAMVGVDVAGTRVLVACVSGHYYALRAKCNHMGGPLDKGTLEGNVVTCPFHGSKWDVKTGNLVQFTRPLPPEPVYKVTIEGDQVSVEV